MPKSFKRPLSIALGVLATTALGGCYYGGVNGASYASAGGRCADSYYDYDPYAYDDGYGYDCYDGSDYGSGFVQIGFGGGWYDDYYYPGYGTWMFDRYRNRYPLRDQYLNYWGGRRAWWKHHGHSGNRPGNGRPDYDRPGRPGHGGVGRPPVPGQPSVRPDRPNRPGAGNPGGGWRPPVTGQPGTRPDRPHRPGGRPPVTGNPDNGWQPPVAGQPGARPDRPHRPGGGRPPVAGTPGGGRPLVTSQPGARPDRPTRPSIVRPGRGDGATATPRPAPEARPDRPMPRSTESRRPGRARND